MNDRSLASEILMGLTLTRIEKLPHDYWVFHFGDAVRLNVEAPWRVMSPHSILVTREDDGQKFGLATPVDAEAILRQHVQSRRVTSVEVDSASADLTLRFDNQVAFEILNLSSGYECWTLTSKDEFIIVGRNG
jgi:hypothetical protein